MQKWEYTHVTARAGLATVNMLAAEGWRVVDVSRPILADGSTSRSFDFILEREVPAAPQEPVLDIFLGADA